MSSKHANRIFVRALQQLASVDGKGEEDTPEELTYRYNMWKTSREYFIISSYRRAIEQEKTIYKESFDKLKVLKPEIEHIRKVCGTIAYIYNKISQFYSSFRFLNVVEKLSNSSLINGTERYILEGQKSYFNSKKKPSVPHQFMPTIRIRVMSTTTSLHSTKQKRNYYDADISH